jgi:HEAT repeat protein
MPVKSQTVTQLWDRLRAASTFEQAYAVLDEVVGIEDRSIEAADKRSLQFASLDVLRRLTASDVERGRRTIFAFLLPACLTPSSESPVETRLEIQRFREILREWLEQYLGREKLKLRDEVLDTLCDILQREPGQEPIWTIQEIGYRSPRVEHILWPLVQRRDDVGDIALSAVVSLGVPRSKYRAVLSAVRKRANFRPMRSLLYPIQELAHSSFVELITNKFRTASEEDWLNAFALSLLAGIANAAPEDSKAQDKVWSSIFALVRTGPARARTELYFSSGVAPRCNTPRAITDFLGLLLHDIEPAKSTTDRRYLAYLRLGECVRPRHILGWQKPHVPRVISLLKRDACRSAKETSDRDSRELETKIESWKILFSLQVQESLTWLQEALGSEKNYAVVADVLEVASCFSLTTLPSFVLGLIRDRRNITRGEHAPDLFARLAAVRLAHSAATVQAFDALLAFGLTHENHVLNENVDALAGVAIELTKAGDGNIVRRVFERISDENELHHRAAALAVIRKLAVEKLVTADAFEQLEPLANAVGVPPYINALAIGAIAFLPPDQVREKAFPLLERLLNHDDEQVAAQALEAIVRHGSWRRAVDRIADFLHLRKEKTLWTVDEPAKRGAWEAAILGLLFSDDHLTFAPAVKAIVRDGQADAVYHVLVHSLGRNGDADPAHLSEAVLARISSVYTTLIAETSLFRIFLRLSSDQFLSEPWEGQWSRWLPDARVAFADAVGELVRRGSAVDMDRATTLLRELMTDGVYAVRRAAMRALLLVDLRAFTGTCLAWYESKQPELRARAAEAIGWLPKSEEKQFCRMFNQLSTDVEPSIRPLAERSRTERFERRWADSYADRVRAVTGKNGNAEVFQGFIYGGGLSRLGEDYHVQQLAAHLAQSDLPLHIRYWIRGIAKAINKRWEKVTREWPQPWLSWDGTIEELEGSVVAETGEITVHFSLWRKMREDLNLPSEWGGALWSTRGESLWRRAALQDLHMRIPGRRDAYGRITYQSSSGLVVFEGSGPYPDRT